MIETVFKYGFIEMTCADHDTQMVSTRWCIPVVLLHDLLNALISHGSINNVEIKNPLAVWVPPLDRSQFKDRSIPETVLNSVNVALKDEAVRQAKIYEHLSSYVQDVNSLIPILPLGVYVVFTYNIGFSSALNLLEDFDKVRVFGVDRITYTIAKILSEVVEVRVGLLPEGE